MVSLCAEESPLTADRHQFDQARTRAALPLAAVVARCGVERRRYQAEGTLQSPACADALQQGRILPGGSFVFANLLDGRYTLRLLIADEEVVVRSVVVP